MLRISRLALISMLIAIHSAPAFAHPGHGLHNTLTQGFLHPLDGVDHVLAMVCVGFLAFSLGGRKDALDAALETLERSFDALGQGATALNHKVIDIAQRNINSGFDLAKNLTKAKNLAEIIELQATYWREQFGVLANQAEEVRSLSTQVAADAAKPIKSQMARGMDGRTH